ncbi:acyltransferase family protein [Pseudomonas izuensis]|uniref:acyltransferase family protein n=1 Tax=Pseudomonas izuensis TaxID=2684212 RepID=UPI0013572C0F|nr:acyltransferase [Pseudomonas izuensis]
MNENKLEFANILRGLAAIFVVLSHYLHNAWEMRPLVENFANVKMPTEELVPTPIYVKMLDIVPHFDWGGYGVGIFFLVSGLVIPLSIKKYSTLAFLIGRAFRLWPVYAAGFTISILSMYVAGIYFNKPFQYTYWQVAIHYLLGIRDLIWSANIDGIIWTLEIEIKFYIVCALLAPFIRKGNPLIFVAPIAIAVSCFLAGIYMKNHGVEQVIWRLAYMLTLSGQFIVFMFLGTVYSFWINGELKTKAAILISAILLGTFFALLLWGPHKDMTSIEWGGYLAAVVTFILFTMYKRKSGTIFTFLSKISYPLYASHGAMGYVVIALALSFGASPKIAIATAIFTAIIVAYALHHLVETPTHRKGQKIARALTTINKPGVSKVKSAETA